MGLPEVFCWTRFGTEAGETAAEIFERKERERCANGGTFLWGIGNAIGPSLLRLLAHTSKPKVIFSPMQSAPKARDVSPERVVRWLKGRTLEGDIIDLPRDSYVTSGHIAGSRLRRRYALVCDRSEPIRHRELGRFYMGQLFNLASGCDVGSSQVTAVVGWEASRPATGPAYVVALRATLVHPYFVELAEPEEAAPAAKKTFAA